MPTRLVHVTLLMLAVAASNTLYAQDRARVTVMTPAAADFGERFSVSGTLSAERAARLSARVDGLVSAVRVDAGDVVAAGELLLELDPALAQRTLERVRAEAEQAIAAQGEAERRVAEARRLGGQNFIASSEIEVRESELALATAALASARAREREQAESLQRHQLPAPFAGVIAAKLTEVGEWVQRGTPVLDLVAIDRVRIDLRVPQERYADIDELTRFDVYANALGDQPLPARLGAKVPVTDPSARTFLLRLLLDEPDARLLPGTSVRAEISLPPREPALAVSRDALLRQPDGGYSLFIVEDTGSGQLLARQRTVRILRDQGDQVAIAEGLQAGERVVIRGNEALRDGQAVELTGN